MVTPTDKLGHDDRRWIAISLARANAGTPYYQVPPTLESLAAGQTTPAWAVLEARKILTSHQGA